LNLSTDLEAALKTYGNGDYFSRKLYRASGIAYELKVESYLSLSPSKSYITYSEFTGNNFPPSGQSIRQLYTFAEQSLNTPYGYNNFERYTREIQAVRTNGAVAIDWTFQVCKNYILPGAKACFTMCTETGEVAALALVENTSVSQVAHLLQELVTKRTDFRPKTLYSDTWPHNLTFWKNIFGFCLVGRLGFFHLIKRIHDTLNTQCNLYWRALVQLKHVFYRYNDEDEAQLITALKEGTGNNFFHLRHVCIILASG